MKNLPVNLSQFLWHFIKPYKRYLVFFIITGLVWGLQVSFSPYILKLIIDKIMQQTGDLASRIKDIQYLALIYVSIWTVTAINFRFHDLVKLKFFPELRKDMYLGVFEYLGRHSLEYFQNNFAGSLSNKISDLSTGTIAILRKLDEYFANLVMVVIASIIMFSVSPLFTGILLAWLFLIFIVTLKFTKNISVLSKDFSESKSMVMGSTVDSISNIMNIKSFARIYFEKDRVTDALDETVTKDRRMEKAILIMRLWQDAISAILIASMFFGLTYLYKNGLVVAGDFVFILTISLSILQSIWWITNTLVEFSEDLGKCSQAISIITKSHDVKDLPDAKELKVEKGKIVFNKVSFAYKGSSHIFYNKDITINPGEKIGLVGFSGSGKSTFVNLILRFYDIESGSIEIDDQDISKVTQLSLRSAITFIPQDTSLFHRTLLENIRYGNISATDEEVIDAAKKAYCHEFICQIPEKYNAMVGERGIKLSGGQRQRISIARAVLKNSPILILDEATSALDSVTEEKIKNSLYELMQNKTAIVIAHRLSTLAEMDRILVFDNGAIIEEGTHSQLIAKNGHYARMWQMQAGGFLPESDNISD